jgi:hypothetical protein
MSSISRWKHDWFCDMPIVHNIRGFHPWREGNVGCFGIEQDSHIKLGYHDTMIPVELSTGKNRFRVWVGLQKNKWLLRKEWASNNRLKQHTTKKWVSRVGEHSGITSGKQSWYQLYKVSCNNHVGLVGVGGVEEQKVYDISKINIENLLRITPVLLFSWLSEVT